MTRVRRTGVAGAVGTRLASKLAFDDEVTEVVGVDVAPLAVALPKVSFHQVDVAGIGAQSPLLKDVDAVVHLLPPGSNAGVARFLRSCSKANLESFVMASSAAVYGAWPDNDFPLLESSPLKPNPGFDLASGFVEQERIVATHRPARSVAVIRMATLMGTERQDRAVWDALTRVDWTASRPMQFLNLGDAVEAFALALRKRLDGVYNAGADFVSAEKAREISGVIGVSSLPASLGVPLDAAMWKQRRYAEDFARLGKYLEHPWVVSSDKLRSEGWVPGMTSKEALVAARRPVGWERLTPGRRRVLISGALTAVPVVATAVGVAAGIKAARSARR